MVGVLVDGQIVSDIGRLVVDTTLTAARDIPRVILIAVRGPRDAKHCREEQRAESESKVPVVVTG